MSTDQLPPASGSSSQGPILWLATGLGLGYSPIMPGTCGALLGLPLAWGIAQLPSFGALAAVWTQLVAVAVLLLIGVPLCTAAANRLGGKKDPAAVVWDEIATVPIVFLGLPTHLLSLGSLSTVWILPLGFLLHRVFDILKPPPCQWLERLPRGLGIMADDVAAAIYACGVLRGLLYVLGVHTS